MRARLWGGSEDILEKFDANNVINKLNEKFDANNVINKLNYV